MSETPNVKVVHISTVHPAADSRIYEKECYSLATAGYHVTLIATGTPPTDPTPVRVITRPRIKHRGLRFVFGPLRAIRMALRLKPDVIHLHDPELIPLGALCRLRGYNVIFDSHEDIPESMGHKPYLPRPLSTGLRMASHSLIWLVNRTGIHTISATPHIARRFPGSVVIQNFPRASDWPVTTGRRAPARLVYVGGITEPRGLWPMVNAVALLRRSIPDVTLTLAGPISAPLLTRLETHLADGGVQYVGELSRHEVVGLLSKSTIGLVLFDPSPNNLNGRPTKLYEYMAAGIPCIASDFPLWREMVLEPDVGLVANPLSPEAIAEAVRTLLDDPKRAAAMGRRGREWVETHRNWDTEASSLLSLYASL
jgi:glycosyltransferase involved in cell wall biosynthesis